ncbi:MAG: TerD family protein [Ignavibacteria bacterium]
MAINLKKGGKINLKKEAPGLVKIGVGLGWSPNEEPGGPTFDLDASAFMLGSDFQIVNLGFYVFYNNQESQDGSVKSSGDELVGGSGEGDDETLFVDLPNVDPRVQQIIFTVTISKYPNDANNDQRTASQNFGMVENCYIRIYNQLTNMEIVRYNLNEKFTNEDAVEFGRLYRSGDSWEFEAMGRATTGSMDTFVEMYAEKFK